MQIPEAAQASQTIIIGFASMFLPSILIEGVQNDITRFVIGALSISQLIYLSRSRRQHWFEDSCKYRQIVYDFLD